MSPAVWTADAGNSALKFVLWAWPVAEGARPRPLFVRAIAREDELEARFEALLASLARGRMPDEDAPSPPLVAGALSSVLDAATGARLAEVARRVTGRPVHAPPRPGLVVECDAPDRVGQDRLFAALAAARLVRGSAVVVDVGTAMTVDAVAWDGDPEIAPRFVGGAIAPGPALLARSLASGTARLVAVDARPGVPALGRDTEGALRSGIVHGLRGAAAELMHRVGLAAGIATAPRVVTGGAAALLLEPTPCWSGDLVHEPHLVPLGLLDSLRALV